MKKTSRTLAGITALAMALGSASCTTTSTSSDQSSSTSPPIVLPPPGPYQVTVDSRWTYSAYENRPAADWLLRRARDSAAEGPLGLDRLVRRWPDIALELMRDGVATPADLPTLLAIADSYDRTGETADPAAGWHAALDIAASQRDAYGPYRTMRVHLLAIFQSGQFAEAAKLDPVATLPAGAPPAFQTEALRLAGLSALLNDHPDRAADCFARAAAWSRKAPHHVQFEIGLLQSEAQRRMDSPQAAATWQAAVISGADVRDPDLWERAILTRPGTTPWPAQAAIGSAGEPDFDGSSPPDTADVLIGIGKMRLVRGATQAALLAFSRADSETTNPGKKSLAQLYRVQSMIVLQTVASAIPMLDGLMKSSDPRIAVRAQALEGDIYCRILGDSARGIPMLRDALNNASSGDWPGKSRLFANLALYDLIAGNDHDGLRLLHMAQAQFEADSQWEDLANSLLDEAAYLRSADQGNDADAVQRRADEICRQAGLPAGPLTDQAAADSADRDAPKAQ
jgi:hypothetical protein